MPCTGSPALHAPDTASAHKAAPKRDAEGYLGRLQENVFTQPKILANASQFVSVKIDIEKDAAASKELDIAKNFERADKKTYRPPSRQGFVFTRADGKIYGRLYCPLTATLRDMMEGVLKAHSPMDSPICKDPYKTKMVYKPYKVPYKGRPAQLEFPPPTQTWHECPKCRDRSSGVPHPHDRAGCIRGSRHQHKSPQARRCRPDWRAIDQQQGQQTQIRHAEEFPQAAALTPPRPPDAGKRSCKQ